jgi:hypothetical protein
MTLPSKQPCPILGDSEQEGVRPGTAVGAADTGVVGDIMSVFLTFPFSLIRLVSNGRHDEFPHQARLAGN